MPLSMTELELQSTELLPTREVMTCMGAPGPDSHAHGAEQGHVVDSGDGNEYEGGILNDVNLQNILTDIDVEEIQAPALVNVLAEDFNDTLDVGTANDDAIANVED